MNLCQSHKYYNNMSNERTEKNIQCNENNAMKYNETTKCTVYETTHINYKRTFGAKMITECLHC